MNSPIIQLLVLAGIAIFLILRLRNVLGTREGFEKPPAQQSSAPDRALSDFEVIEGGPDHDITDHVPEGGDAYNALLGMKKVDPSFNVGEFLGGARGAYEMILMAFERGEIEEIKPFLSSDVYEAFATVVDDRKAKGVTIEANFVGISDMALNAADFNETTGEAEIAVRFVGEMTSIVRDKGGDVIEGSETTVKRQKDTWTFARDMDADDPNWDLVATGE
ncbi:Tim44/TimA family putative adaptor protein [Thalassobium sp. R2A62]|uniref:Tim44/TimA family putative adaptor protein n=1 Tax=Thalassobium sp. R2A62 TaxID=633131 RepID=UPI0001B1D29C|nr:Tim44/TimA family putative adaptor protein [Thalassobium sp. R2A62]EET48178.1 transporter, Tim44 family [Thalassobium sp. R2A62]MDG1339961.1 Tim44/TimA family putative adaptor protein [Paracoccaceae bacterium]MDG1801745.1 Tim44/TimA family putative adaptor protein [Paracoccaceae bacterium]MDG2452286.1 Tim44/TimA family putative adaptor protein [Paracoccaceae bacterium]